MGKFHRYRGKNRRGGRRHFQHNHSGGRNNVKLAEEYVPPSCSECNKVAPAYKCPVCFKKYCSAVCCKEHKMHCSSSVSLETDTTLEPKASENKGERIKRGYAYEFPTKDTVPVEKLMEIKDDERIHSLLKSTKLRGLITKLDEMQNPANSFRDIMQDSEFRAFSNVVLEIVGVKDEYNISHSTSENS